MQLGNVVGPAEATVKNPTLAGERMLVQQLASTQGLDPVTALASWHTSDGGALLAVRLTGVVIIRDGTLPFPSSRDTFGAHEALRHPAVRP